MHANTASISSSKKQTQLGLAIAAAQEKKKAASCSDVLRGMLAKSVGGVVSMPPGIAARVLDEMNFSGQRKRTQFRVGEHLARIRKGIFNAQFPISLVAFPDGTMWLVDGQHRLAAISQCGHSVMVRVNVMTADSEHEARRIYSGFDRPEFNRTVNEMLDGLGVIAETGLKRDTTRALFRALPIILNNMEPSRNSVRDEMHVRSIENRIDLLPEWSREAVEYESIVKSAQPALKRPLLGAGVMAVALYTFRHQPERAREFWAGVIGSESLHKDDPRQRLMWDLLNRNLSAGSLRQGVQMAALAWTRWCEGTHIKMIKLYEGASIVIWGTPLAKGNK